ncbi:hypothetical protein PVAP13_5NG090200 [Panicum virgatum]|uniref:Factor of DNA methylation 1-5/IDN2 domain-containing protein n=1 Tax=Panicum virgatum TaxID=38727 RepID=A0A8T0RR45_PANVG|nr:hypothetical protein PVAP13_5NG090200 [Panicum virgatum]
MPTDDVLMADAGADELLVWPWTGILAMAAADEDADAATTLAFHAHQRFAGVATTALQEEPTNHQQHFLLLHFGKNWAGLRDAMSLAVHFAGAGRREWQRRGREGSSEGAGGVFGWAAVGEDLLGDGAVGRILRESGAAARSVEDVEKDEASVAVTLSAVAGEYERRERLLAAKNEEMVRAVQRMEEESSWLRSELNELKAVADNSLPEMNHGVDEENEKLRAELDAVKGEIELRVDRIQELKECRTDLHFSKLEKEEMEAINAKVIQLEKQLEQKEAQEYAICMLNTKLQAVENLSIEEYGHLYKLLTILKECLEQKSERFQNAYVELTQRDHLNRNELQETRQEVIKCLESMATGDCTVIGIKRMGQLDEKPFHHACKRKYRDYDPEGKGTRLISLWQKELKNKSWNPFTTILVDGEEKDVVNEDDPKLRQLWTEYGDIVCNAVKVTLRELNEYSPQGRHAVNELWNFREGRKATTAEVVNYIFEQQKTSS